MALELPSYKRPSLRTAAIASYDRGLIFLRKAGTAILAVSIVLWWLGAFPKVDPAAAVQREQTAVRERIEVLDARRDSLRLRMGDTPVAGSPDHVEFGRLDAERDRLTARLSASNTLAPRYQKAQSYLGRLGRAVEPVLRPLGYDWQLSVGVLASFAAREVFVGTMSIVVAGGEEGDDEAENLRIREALATATRDDGVTLVFNRATCWSLLVYYVLAMQCIPTLVVTAREAGGVKWALLQLVWMSAVAYGAAWLAYTVASA